MGGHFGVETKGGSGGVEKSLSIGDFGHKQACDVQETLQKGWGPFVSAGWREMGVNGLLTQSILG